MHFVWNDVNNNGQMDRLNALVGLLMLRQLAQIKCFCILFFRIRIEQNVNVTVTAASVVRSGDKDYLNWEAAAESLKGSHFEEVKRMARDYRKAVGQVAAMAKREGS
ncbi:hypothetical protein L6164_019077 [Bauhinia variegata]|uniref:Uncharacterized protein n=1 Tax=Bauhinia variegata TaxID=167791 RepID=A0ACB9ND24_BAUVA|nr:hypothetical protein L6164_019077 [Bauhinia variegata]